MIRHVSSTPSWRVNRVRLSDHRGVEQDLVRRRALAALSANSMSNWIGAAVPGVRATGIEDDSHARRRIELDHELVRLGPALERREAETRRVLEDETDLGLRHRAAACRRG